MEKLNFVTETSHFFWEGCTLAFISYLLCVQTSKVGKEFCSYSAGALFIDMYLGDIIGQGVA